MPRHRSHSVDFKRQVVAEYQAGGTLLALSRLPVEQGSVLIGLPRSTYHAVPKAKPSDADATILLPVDGANSAQ